MTFLDRGLNRIAETITAASFQAASAARPGFFQQLDPRIKLLFLLFYVLVVSLKKTLLPELLIGGGMVCLVFMARIPFLRFWKRVGLMAFVFGFLLSLPSSLNLVTRGNILFPILNLDRPHDFLVYHIPAGIGITREGLGVVALLTLRVLNSAAISFFVLAVTPFPLIIKALKTFRIPDSVLVILTLSYQYLFLLLKTVEEMHLAKKARLVCPGEAEEARAWAGGRIAFIFRRTRLRGEEIYRAMLSRGFSGEMRLHGMGRPGVVDVLSAGVLLLPGVVLLWI